MLTSPIISVVVGDFDIGNRVDVDFEDVGMLPLHNLLIAPVN